MFFLTTYLFHVVNGGFFQHFGELFWSRYSVILKFPSGFEITPKKGSGKLNENTFRYVKPSSL